MPKARVPQHVIRRLREIRETATMEHAGFGGFYDDMEMLRKLAKNPTGGAVTEYVREVTRLWRNSWIISPLDELIRWAEGEGKDLDRRVKS